MPISCRLLSLRASSLALVQAGSQRRSLSTASSKKREMASGKMVMVPLHLSHCRRYERDEPGAVTKGTVQFGTGRADCEAVRSTFTDGEISRRAGSHRQFVTKNPHRKCRPEHYGRVPARDGNRSDGYCRSDNGRQN